MDCVQGHFSMSGSERYLITSRELCLIVGFVENNKK